MPDSEEQLPHLTTFCKAAELGGFTAAARELRITQAAVSQRISALERSLRTSLFDRRAGRILLTDAGRQLYAYAQRIMELHREARQTLTGQRAAIRGELLLGASSIPGDHLLPAALSIFRRQYPGIHVRVETSGSTAVLELVERGKVQLGLVGLKTDNSRLDFRPFATDELWVVVPPGHAWSRRKQISYRQFSMQPLVIREQGSGSRWCFEHALAESGRSIDDLRIGLELGSNEAIKEAVVEGMGVAVLSGLAIQSDASSGRLHALRISGLSLQRSLFVAFDARRALPPPARAFLQFVEASPRAVSP